MAEILLNVIGFGFMFGGAWIASGEFPLDVPRPGAMGMIIGGLGLGTFYLDALLFGRVDFHARDNNERSYVVATYTGWTARLYGLLILFISSLIIMAGAVEWIWPGAIWPWLKSSFGIGVALVIVGFALAGRAALTLAHALITAKENKTVWQRLNGLPSYVIGVSGVCIGLLLFGLGGLQLSSPGILERTVQTWIDENIGPIPTPPTLPDSLNK